VRYGICLANIGTYSNPRAAMEMAAAGEASGWDGIFVWDHLAFVWDRAAADPWVVLAAVAATTERMRVGTAVTPVARRRPQVLAHQVATLDVLSGGRVIFGAGLGGVASEFSKFGEAADAAVRAERLDEGLDVLRALWAGEHVVHAGKHYTVDGVTLSPLPVQRTLPVWIGGNRSPSQRRAARWDGWCADSSDPTGMTLSPDEVARGVETIGRDDDFDVAVIGYHDRIAPGKYERAGATWWMESIHDMRGSYDEMVSLVGRGPPR
jgi:alkanesulfonate monooxygenase SsuD/methylene tetrahydromethanopterin reductase-like flavin-dependent oxidoreductase (luciferase family)